MKQVKTQPETPDSDGEKTLKYTVIYQGEIVFTDECRAICNSFICRNQLQGVRPQPVYE